MFPLTDGFFEVRRPESRGGGQDGYVTQGNRFLELVESDELAFLRDVDPVRMVFLEVVQGTSQAVLMDVGHGHQFDGTDVVGTQSLVGGSGPAAAAADQRDLEGVVARGAQGKAFGRERTEHGGSRNQRGTPLQKVAA